MREAGDLPNSSSEAPAAAPLASVPAAPPELNGERAPLDIGLDVMVTSEGLEAREVLPQIHDAQPRRHTFRRRVRTPFILFLVTSLSTWFAGATLWMPFYYLFGAVIGTPILWGGFETGLYYPHHLDFMELRQVLLVHWFDGLLYMICVQLILFSHEMGHFLYAVYYRVRCTLPYFIPFPIAPTGTMGAVIAMEGHKANRPQIFDIGIAGPIAGLCLAVPILWLGVRNLNFDVPAGGGMALDLPLAIRWLVDQMHPGKLGETNHVWLSQSNPYFIAGWFGFIMTALNMLPVSQLDGGHITYTLWGKGAHWVARGFMVFVFAYIAFTGNGAGSLMAVLVMLIGTDHPPTSDDKVPIGWFRILLGHASLIIPIVCFTPKFLVIE
ncbi:MAG: site-2 protease family protein [Planctomycetales bacterium]|nr:site-2 protease family protein [Planctomycetales bacterium]